MLKGGKKVVGSFHACLPCMVQVYSVGSRHESCGFACPAFMYNGVATTQNTAADRQAVMGSLPTGA